MQKHKCIISKNKMLYIIIFLLFSFYITLNLITQISNGKIDNDIYFMFAHGEYIIRNGFTHVEPFSIHSNFQFMIPQWLTAVILYIVHLHTGTRGIVLFFSIVFIITELVLFHLLRLISNNNVLSALLAGLSMTFISSYMFSTRPYIISLLIILIELYSFEKYVLQSKARYLIIIPFLSVIEINFHNSLWIMMILVSLPYFIEGFINHRYKIHLLSITMMISTLCALINPYGVESITYIFKSMISIKPISNIIIELAPASMNNTLGLITIMINFGLFIGLFVFQNFKIKLRHILLYLGTCLMALIAIRNSIFFYPISMLVYVFVFKNIKCDSISNKITKYIHSITIFMIISCGVTFLLMEKSDVHNPNLSSIFSKDAIDWLSENENPEEIILYNNINDGAYLLYKGFKVYIDPRLEVYGEKNNKKEDILLEYLKIRSADIYYKDFLHKYDFNLLLLNKSMDKYLYQTIKYDFDYVSIYEDDISVIYKKK